ncbi:MAG: 30S ribosomal protein S9 [Patescibacteria group bacterium]
MPEEKKETRKYYQGTGRRKNAIARVRIYEKGEGKFIVNDIEQKKFFKFFEYEQQAVSPLDFTDKKDKLDISVKVSGGGLRGQAEAIRHGVARALVDMDEELKPALRKQGYMTRDPRSKERKKPGLKRARRASQWRKR